MFANYKDWNRWNVPFHTTLHWQWLYCAGKYPHLPQRIFWFKPAKGVLLKRRPKNENLRPKTPWTKTKTLWTKTKTRWTKTKTPWTKTKTPWTKRKTPWTKTKTSWPKWRPHGLKRRPHGLNRLMLTAKGNAHSRNLLRRFENVVEFPLQYLVVIVKSITYLSCRFLCGKYFACFKPLWKCLRCG